MKYPMNYTTAGLRKKWCDFWRSKSHIIIPSSPVIPDNDPTALFINSGMHPLVPYLMGQPHPEGTMLANAQKCIRTGDIEEVGDATHLTFFEMLGNWSLQGAYFKKEQIPWSFEFLTEVLELPLEKLAVSVFAGDENAPRDEFSAKTWEDLGMPKSRIAYLGKEDNWWAKGEVGPCGPDTEMFYWTGDEPAPENFQDTSDDERWVEIWNDVFMQFNKKEDGTLEDLPAQNIDTGMGLDRTVFVLNGMKSVYQTDAFEEILQKISKESGKPEIADNPIGETDVHISARIIADHLRSSVVILTDNISPSNVDQGYILRRLIRRAVRHGRKIGIIENLCIPIAHAVIYSLQGAYPEIKTNQKFILEELEREETQFRKTLVAGEKEFEKLAQNYQDSIPGEKAFFLYETYGFPWEMTIELAEEKGLRVNEKEFQEAFKSHQEKSRAGQENKFVGGLAGSSENETKLHTATHLLHAGLRKVLGEHVEQRGSNITPDRLRFDFCHEKKLTPEQITEIENYINKAIKADVAITCEEMTVTEAEAQGSIGLFGHKYGKKVKVFTMGDFSKEICGGPHAARTGDLVGFKIKKEESSSRGVRRVKAVIGG